MIDISQGLYRAVLAITVTANRVLTFPDATDTVVLLNAVQTITNKLLAYTSITGTPAARATNSADQVIGTASFTALTFDTESFDTAALHSTSTNTSRMTAPVTGKYHCSATVLFAPNATGQRVLRLRTGGTAYIAAQSHPVSSATNYSSLTVCADVVLTAAEYVEAVVFQDSGGNLNSAAVVAGMAPVFSMHWIGP